MLDSLALRTVDRVEVQTGQNADYLRDMVRHGSTAFLKFLLAMPMIHHRKVLSKKDLHLAQLVASRHEDCGPCVQIGVDMALADGVAPEHLCQVLDGELETLPEPTRSICLLARAVAQASPEANGLSDELAERLGKGALVDVGMAVVGGRLFPTLKRALGHARSCSQVQIRVPAEPKGG